MICDVAPQGYCRDGIAVSEQLKNPMQIVAGYYISLKISRGNPALRELLTRGKMEQTITVW